MNTNTNTNTNTIEIYIWNYTGIHNNKVIDHRVKPDYEWTLYWRGTNPLVALIKVYQARRSSAALGHIKIEYRF